MLLYKNLNVFKQIDSVSSWCVVDDFNASYCSWERRGVNGKARSDPSQSKIFNYLINDL
jgi:hypothetical protein